MDQYYREYLRIRFQLERGLMFNLHRAFQFPDSEERKELVELFLQNLPPSELPEDSILSLVNERIDKAYNKFRGPTWDFPYFTLYEMAYGLTMTVKNSLFDVLTADDLRLKNGPSLPLQFLDILKQKSQCYEFTGEDCPHEEKIYSLMHQCADTTPQNSQSSESAGVRVYERNKPSVVRIDTILRRVDASTLDVSEVPQELGSGIVWDERGHILTNYHVIRGLGIHSHVRVKLADQSTHVAEVVSVEPDNDVAVLRINAPKHKLKPICVGNSADLRVGEKVYASGNPFGFNHSFTKGVISALDREINSVTGRPMQDMIQTDAAINPGNSGGALFDKSGNFIGMNTSISSRCRESCGIGFAIPVDKLSRIFDDYVKQNVGTNLAPVQFVEQVGGLEVIKQKIMALLDDIVTFMKEMEVPNQSDLYSTLGQCKMGVKMFPGMEQHGSEILLARDVCAS